MTPHPAVELLADCRAAGVALVLAPDGDARVRFEGARPDALLERLRPHKRALAAVLAGREPDTCFGCEIHPISPTPVTIAFAVGCDHADCPHRVGGPHGPGSHPEGGRQ